MATQKEIISYIEEINERLDDKKQRDIFIKHYLDNGKCRNTEKRYQVVSAMVNDKYGKGTISDTTTWRILKIHQTSSVAFNRIKNEECSIKTIYNELFPPAKKEIQKSENISNLSELCDYIKNLNEFYQENQYKLENPPVKDMKNLDDELFKMRKLLNKIIANADNYELWKCKKNIKI